MQEEEEITGRSIGAGSQLRATSWPTLEDQATTEVTDPFGRNRERAVARPTVDHDDFSRRCKSVERGEESGKHPLFLKCRYDNAEHILGKSTQEQDPAASIRANRVESVTTIPMIAEGNEARPWSRPHDPATVVVVRLHAFGDLLITFPVITALRRRLPKSRITLVTSTEYCAIARVLLPVDRILGIDTRAVRPLRLASMLAVVPSTMRPDLLLDLQHSSISDIYRHLIRPRSFATFDRFAPRHAFDRSCDVLDAAGLDGMTPRFEPLLPDPRRKQLVEDFALPDDQRPTICLNPAGCWETKQWPADRYATLADRLGEAFDARILLVGTTNVRDGADVIVAHSGAEIIDLVGKTTQLEALALLMSVDLLISDDSGLMHMAWTQGVPTIALFGATRAAWSRPLGSKSITFTSDDLDCGGCMAVDCMREDRFCLERIEVEEIFDRAATMMRASTK